MDNAFGAQTREVRLISTTACHVAFGAAPLATANDPYLAADEEYVVRVSPGQKVAAIQNAAGGTLFVTELTM